MCCFFLLKNQKWECQQNSSAFILTSRELRSKQADRAHFPPGSEVPSAATFSMGLCLEQEDLNVVLSVWLEQQRSTLFSTAQCPDLLLVQRASVQAAAGHLLPASGLNGSWVRVCSWRWSYLQRSPCWGVVIPADGSERSNGAGLSVYTRNLIGAVVQSWIRRRRESANEMWPFPSAQTWLLSLFLAVLYRRFQGDGSTTPRLDSQWRLSQVRR